MNNDGDLLVANDSTPNDLCINKGDGTFEGASYAFGYALNKEGRETASMGIAVGDYQNNGQVDSQKIAKGYVDRFSAGHPFLPLNMTTDNGSLSIPRVTCASIMRSRRRVFPGTYMIWRSVVQTSGSQLTGAVASPTPSPTQGVQAACDGAGIR